jgi:hypothetical protein
MLAFWATPTMSVGHLLLAEVATTYLVVAVMFENGNLVGIFQVSRFDAVPAAQTELITLT